MSRLIERPLSLPSSSLRGRSSSVWDIERAPRASPRPLGASSARRPRRAVESPPARVVAVLLEKDELPDLPVFRGAEKAALCVCTIGPELEEDRGPPVC